jgi:hypothetical protein
MSQRSTAGGANAALVQLGSDGRAGRDAASLNFLDDREHVGVTLLGGGL